MNKFIEYMKLLPSGLANIDKVVEGVVNDVKLKNGSLSEEDTDIIIKRRLICETCPYNSVNAIKAGYYATKRTDVHCMMCGCPIDIRTASLESNCGIETFNKNNPDEKMELKWVKK